MKTTMYPLFIGCLLMTACSDRVKIKEGNIRDSQATERIHAVYTDSVYCDDLNLDGYPDTIFVITSPAISPIDSSGNPIHTIGCPTGDCQNRIHFSCDWPDLSVENSLRATVVRVGDLNFDGNSELLVSPNWFIGYQKQAFLYSLQNDKWEIAAQVYCRLYGDDSANELSDSLLRKNGKWYLKGTRIEKDDESYTVPVDL